MTIDTVHPDSDFSNSVVPEGTVLVFAGYENGVAGGCIVIRCKTSSGTFYNLTGCGGHLPEQSSVSSDAGISSDSSEGSLDCCTCTDCIGIFERLVYEGSFPHAYEESQQQTAIEGVPDSFPVRVYSSDWIPRSCSPGETEIEEDTCYDCVWTATESVVATLQGIKHVDFPQSSPGYVCKAGIAEYSIPDWGDFSVLVTYEGYRNTTSEIVDCGFVVRVYTSTLTVAPGGPVIIFEGQQVPDCFSHGVYLSIQEVYE